MLHVVRVVLERSKDGSETDNLPPKTLARHNAIDKYYRNMHVQGLQRGEQGISSSTSLTEGDCLLVKQDVFRLKQEANESAMTALETANGAGTTAKRPCSSVDRVLWIGGVVLMNPQKTSELPRRNLVWHRRGRGLFAGI